MEPFVGEIKMFAGNFAPRGFALCDGQLLQIAQNTVLFSLFGTFYGGDGRTTFGLPDLRGRLPVHMGNGPGLTNRPIGQKSGSETATISTSQMPAHTHTMFASGDSGSDSRPEGNVTASNTPIDIYFDTPPATTNMNASAIVGTSGGGSVHNNLMPFLCINFIVSLTGLFPSRN